MQLHLDVGKTWLAGGGGAGGAVAKDLGYQHLQVFFVECFLQEVAFPLSS